MILIRIIIIYLFFSQVCAQEFEAKVILNKVLHRLDGVDHKYYVVFKESRKNQLDKTREFWTFIHWPESDSIIKMVKLNILKPENMKGVAYWEHKIKGLAKSLRWMTMPVTGKLKDVSGRQKSRKEFDLSELELTREAIESHNHQFIKESDVNGSPVFIIESSGGKKRQKKILWIDAEHFFIHKAEFYTKSGRLFREVNCSGIKEFDGVLFPTEIFVKDIKNKFQADIKLSRVALNPDFEPDLFKPSEGLK